MSRVRAGTVPPFVNGHVTRAEIGSALAEALGPGLTASLVPARVPGVPGMPRDWQSAAGKTQAAVAYAEELWAGERVDILVWVTATSRAAVLSTLAEAAVAVRAAGPGTTGAWAPGEWMPADWMPSDGAPGSPAPGAAGAAGPDAGDQAAVTWAPGAAEAAAASLIRWLRRTARPWLVVLDDLAEPAVMAGCWPEGEAGRTLITTTDPDALPASRLGTPVPVGPFSPRQSLAFLMGRLTADLDQRQGAVDLVGQLDHEPLALTQASAVIASSELTCRDYLDALTGRRDRPGPGGPPPAAALTWSLAVEHADLLLPELAHAQLSFSAVLDGNGIPYDVYTAATRRYRVPDSLSAEGLAALETAGLLTADRSVTPPLIRMNWTVAAAIRAAMPSGALAPTAQAAADALLDAWPAAGQPEHLGRAFRSCAETLRRTAGDLLWHDGCHAVLLRCGESLQAAGLAGPAADYWDDLADAGEKALGANHPQTVAIRERLALARLASGQPEQAITLLRSVLAERAVALGRDHPDTARACQDLGRALLAAGRATEAITALGDAVDCYQRAGDPVQVAPAEEDLAAAHASAGHTATAVTLYRQALAIRQRVAGAAHPDTLVTCQKLGDAYLADGLVKNAISMYKRVLDERERSLGAKAPETIGTRGALAAAYFAAGRMSQALQLLEQVRSQYTAVMGAEHRTTLATSLNLANAYQSIGRLTDAVRLLRDTVERCDRSLPDSDSLAIAAREGLAVMTGSG
jgi:tetratricopeptide (TPR) repeat protein